jgi:glyoxylase-like metal-dependent hydrolase (beta-lactamase superfamily II)
MRDSVRPVLRLVTRIAAALTVIICTCLAAAAQQPRIQYYQLVKGFVAESKNSYGRAIGNGFVSDNPWGQYTAFLMATNDKGQRTFRIEHYLPNPATGTAQASTMYVLEGSSRALLIDTANPAKFTLGVNDLKTVIRYLLGHNDDGTPRARPLDFVVANSHNHGDHIGENSLMSDRTVYYMDLDWPTDAPPNYVPIREGGGPTNHGSGTAVSQIDLGDRLVAAVAMPPHTTGSTGYLDAENRMLFTGDAIGSSWPFLQRGPLSQYDESIHHIEEVTRPYPDIAVFPSHFPQIAMWSRGRAPLNGRPLDRQYITDMVTLADGVLAGTIVGEPFSNSADAFWATNDSAQMVYTLPNFYRPGEAGYPYHAVRLPGNFKTESAPAPLTKPMETIFKFGSDFYLIRDNSGESLYLLHGTTSALLIGTGAGEPGLAHFVRALIGNLPLDVAVLDKDPRQAGGIAQLNPRHVYVAASSVVNGVPATVIADGATIDLGLDPSGKRLVVEAASFQSDGAVNLSLLNPSDRVLFAGNAFEKHDAPPASRGGVQGPSPEQDSAARAAWLSKLNGRFDAVYLATSSAWLTAPETFGATVSPAVTSSSGSSKAP